jgi:uncharacterized protein (TIGR00159 family)
MKESGSLNVFAGVLVFLLSWILVTQVLEMKLLGSIFDKLISVGVIALIVLFHEEIRRFLLALGTQHQANNLVQILKGWKKDQKKTNTQMLPVVMACQNMSRNKVGALIVIQRIDTLNSIIDTGEIINANINQLLIENIFFKNSPLHDGAMIISKKRIRAAGCILPVSHDVNIPKSLGLRHRAALGMTQSSDALCVVVSEETGRISVADSGVIKTGLSAEQLESILAHNI